MNIISYLTHTRTSFRRWEWLYFSCLVLSRGVCIIRRLVYPLCDGLLAITFARHLLSQERVLAVEQLTNFEADKSSILQIVVNKHNTAIAQSAMRRNV